MKRSHVASWPKADLPLALTNVRFKIKRTSAYWGESIRRCWQYFRTLDPQLKRLVMSRAAEILEQTNDTAAAAEMLLAGTGDQA